MSAAIVDFGLDLLPSEELHAVLADLRETHRVAPVRFFGTEAVLVTRFDDVKEAFRDDEHLPGGSTYQMHTEPVIGRTFISMDGTEHDRHRQLATPAFRSRAVAQFDEEALVPLAHEIVDRFVARGEADLVAEFTTVLPFYAITRKLGVPRGTDDEMRTWADRMLTYPATPKEQSELPAPSRRCSNRCSTLVAPRRRRTSSRHCSRPRSTARRSTAKRCARPCG